MSRGGFSPAGSFGGIDDGAGAEAAGPAALQRVCASVLCEISPMFRTMRIEARYFAYIGLTHTIRKKPSGVWEIRISDHCRRAPQPVLEAVVRILACKILRRKPSRKQLEAYERFRRDPAIVEAVRLRRLKRGKKRFAPHEGVHHSLSDIYREINHCYFNDQIDIGRIGWGQRPGRRRLGHYDPAHHTITLSPILDSPDVPRFVLEFIVYHEMLHAVYEGMEACGAQRHHPPAFRRAEKAHPHYGSARRFLETYCRRHP